jgi:hypothetical protein
MQQFEFCLWVYCNMQCSIAPHTVAQCQHTALKVWGPPTLKQVLVNQRRPQHLQRPLGQAPLTTMYRDVDIRHTSQLELLLLQDSIWSAHGSSDPPSSSHLDSWEALCQCLLLYGQLAVTRLLNTEYDRHLHKPA